MIFEIIIIISLFIIYLKCNRIIYNQSLIVENQVYIESKILKGDK